MTEKNGEKSPKSDTSELLEENDTEISNFELLYRKTPNPERDKSSGASSDEETTSSSLVPIPETLKQIRNKSKWTLSESGERFGLETKSDLDVKSSGNIINSLEEIRKKYTLKNERSVALKVDSANMMLDDILNSANLMKSSTESLQSKSIREPQLQTKTTPENESSITDSSDSHPQACTHIFDHNHVPVAVEFLASQCHEHFNALQPLRNSSSSIDKDESIPKRYSAFIQRKNAITEKFRNLQIGSRIQSLYKLLQKTKQPFAKSSKVSENINEQKGISDAGYQKNVHFESEILTHNCHHNICPLNYSKKATLDLIEPSKISSCKSNHQCDCIRRRECYCPEVIPKCLCIETTNKARNVSFEGIKTDSMHAESTERSKATQESKKEDESSLLQDKENEDTSSKVDSQDKKKAWRKVFSEEKLIQRTDIYYFDHGNSAYYKTTDDHPKRYIECLIERSDEYGTKFWAEVFGTLEIGTAFLITFIIQLYRFLFTSIIRSLLVGVIQVSSDYFFKPLLTILFNGVIQPFLILAYNIATSTRDLCLPVSQTFGFYAKEVANILRSLRFIEINQDRQSSYCRNRV